jgi:hypothetical protein
MLNGLSQRIGLRLIGQDLYLQCQFHIDNITHLTNKSKSKVWALPLPNKLGELQCPV